jgi:hypothetical protein
MVFSEVCDQHPIRDKFSTCKLGLSLRTVDHSSAKAFESPTGDQEQEADGRAGSRRQVQEEGQTKSILLIVMHLPSASYHLPPASASCNLLLLLPLMKLFTVF